MEFFIDTAEIDEIKEASSWGVIDGVTTNPSLIAKSGKKLEDVIEEISKNSRGPISAEVISTTYNEMLDEAKKLVEIDPKIVVKLPLTIDGLRVCENLKKYVKDAKTNVTLCFSANQALLAAKMGATYISPFVGRLDDIGQYSTDLISQIRKIYDNYDFETKILAASIRHPQHVLDAALNGADVATIPFNVLKKLYEHPMTDIGLERFLKDYEKGTN